MVIINKQSNCRVYLYLDKDGIDSLYRQGRTPPYSHKETTTCTIDGGFEGASSLNHPLSKVFSLTAKAQIDTTENIKKERNIEISYEDKVNYILAEFLSNASTDLSMLPLNSHFSPSRLISCAGLFQLTGVQDETNNRWIMPEEFQMQSFTNAQLVFHFMFFPPSLNIYNSQQYYESCPKVTMMFSGEKMIRNVRHLTNEIRYGKTFLFHVLGQLEDKGKGYYYFLPYAIWRTLETR